MKLQPKYQGIWDELIEEQLLYISAKGEDFNPYDILCKFLQRVIPETRQFVIESYGTDPLCEGDWDEFLKSIIQTEKS